MYHNILVAVDWSKRSEIAFQEALSLAKVSGANLMLLHALSDEEEDFPQFPIYSAYPMLNTQMEEAYQEDLETYKNMGLELLQSRTAEAMKQGITTEFSQNSGIPGHVICDLAQSWHADLVIVGSRGLRGLKEIFLGSVSNYVTHHAPCSVLIVRTLGGGTSVSDIEKESVPINH